MYTETKLNIVRHIYRAVEERAILGELEEDILDTSDGLQSPDCDKDYRPRLFVRLEDLESWPDVEASEAAVMLLDCEPDNDYLDLDDLREVFDMSPIWVATSDDVDSYAYPQESIVDGYEWLLEYR